MQATLPYYIGLIIVAALYLIISVFKEDDDRVIGGLATSICCTGALVLVCGDSLWHHTFYAGHFFGACLGMSLGANLVQSGR